MRLDEADLALLWIDAEKLGELGCGIVRHLIEELRTATDRADAMCVAADEAKEKIDGLEEELAEAASKLDAVESAIA